MGIHDRHYYRETTRPGKGAVDAMRTGVGAWSVTTWLIVACIAVFVIDGFLPRRDIATGMIIGFDGSIVRLDPRKEPDLGPANRAQPVPLVIRDAANQVVAQTSMFCRPLVDKGSGIQVGWAEVHRMSMLQAYLHMSTRQTFLQLELWRLIGFQFLHAGVGHLIANMIGLFFFGPMVEQYLGRKRYLAFYLLSGIFGALMYLALNLAGYIVAVLGGGEVRIPGLLFDDPSTPLIGASAGVFGVIMAGAYLAPNVVVLLFFILPMRLVTLAWGLVLIALMSVLTEGPNAGGEAAHLGGAFAGYYFIRHPKHLHGFFDVLGRADPTSHHYRSGADRQPSQPGPPSNDEIDRVLDKVHREGLRSLTPDEQQVLSRASGGGR
jgi:membrane associated rhomboid family serine protease